MNLKVRVVVPDREMIVGTIDDLTPVQVAEIKELGDEPTVLAIAQIVDTIEDGFELNVAFAGKRLVAYHPLVKIKVLD